MLKHNLEPLLDNFEAISTAASKEYSLEKAMQKMEDDWDDIAFNTTLYRDSGRVNIQAGNSLVWPHEVEPWSHSWYRGRVETLDAKYNLAYINSTLCGYTNSSERAEIISLD